MPVHATAGLSLFSGKGVGAPTIHESVAGSLSAQLAEAKAALGELPTDRRVVLERFPDDSGGTQHELARAYRHISVADMRLGAG